MYARDGITVETDHKPLLSIYKKALGSAPKRLQRMLLRLQRYNFHLTFRPGSQLVLGDTLSRACPATSDSQTQGTSSTFWEELAELIEDEPLNDLSMVASAATISMLRQAAAADEDYQLLKAQIASGRPADVNSLPAALRQFITFADELVVSGDFVYKGSRVVVPRGAREDILTRLHVSHTGINGCIRRARETVYYPGITTDIKKLIEACPICQRHLLEATKEPLMSHPAPSRPWERVGADIFTQASQDYIVCVDYLSGYFEIDRLPSKRSTDVIYALRQQWARHGIPAQLVTDNSPFGSVEFGEFAKKWEFQHITSYPNYPQSNGRAEAAVKMAKKLMQKATEAGTDPFLALLEWRNTPTECSALAPTQIMFGRRTRTCLPTANKLLASASAVQAQTALWESKQRQAIYYDKNAKARPTLSPGQTIRARFGDNDWRKAEVVRVLPHRAYDVQMDDGSVRRRTSRHVKFSSEPPIIRREIGDSSAAVTPPTTASTSSSGNRPPPSTSSVQQKMTVRHTRSGRESQTASSIQRLTVSMLTKYYGDYHLMYRNFL